MPPATAQQAHAINTAVMVGLAIALSLGFSTTLVWALGYLTGWRKLAAQFPAREPLPVAASTFGSIGLYALGNYNNCVRFRMDDECLHISLIPPFSWSHPGMSIPWAAVDITDPELPGSLLTGWGLSRIRVAGVPIRMPRKVIARELELRRELDELRSPEPQIAARSS